jgi:hypothetical protein
MARRVVQTTPLPLPFGGGVWTHPFLASHQSLGGGGLSWAVKENIMVQRKTLQKYFPRPSVGGRLDPILVPPALGGKVEGSFRRQKLKPVFYW